MTPREWLFWAHPRPWSRKDDDTIVDALGFPVIQYDPDGRMRDDIVRDQVDALVTIVNEVTQ